MDKEEDLVTAQHSQRCVSDGERSQKQGGLMANCHLQWRVASEICLTLRADTHWLTKFRASGFLDYKNKQLLPRFRGF